MIVDYAKIELKAGDGGPGDISTLPYSARRMIGGGGDGGTGGDVILKVSPHLYDLNKFNEWRKYVAKDGGKGTDNNRRGADGEDTYVNVPQGTIVGDIEGNVLVDLNTIGQEYVAVRGGKGGEGNFKKMYSIPHELGQTAEFILDYRIANDVAIIGFPNTGKTSLINALTGKNFKVADYPFTTNHCVWAPTEYKGHKFTIMDTPPIKESLIGKEDGNAFLKHLFRSKIIIIVGDNPKACAKEFKAIEEDLNFFEPEYLETKVVIHLLNKSDTFKTAKKTPLAVSCFDPKTILKLKNLIVKSLAE
jgi:GTP-binding protein